MIIQSFHYDTRSPFPTAEALCGPEPEHTVNISMLEEANQNLTAGQKLLLGWHYRFCHLNFQSLQHLLRRAPFVVKGFAAAVKCDPPRCEIFELAKAKRRPKKAVTQTKNLERDRALKSDHLSPGLGVSVDHFECRHHGHTYDSYGKASSQQYKGLCTFVDHASLYVHVEH
jgi:hypothetical protein